MSELFLDESEKEFLRILARRKVQYVLIGGHAVNYHGHERHIGDLDIVIEATEENARRFLSVLRDLRMAGERLTVANLTQPKKKTHIPLYNIDVLTSVDGIPFPELYAGRMAIEFGDLNISMISKEYLLRMKRESSRAEDQQDYNALILQG
jgi:predicted nucleotidyltransferase